MNSFSSFTFQFVILYIFFYFCDLCFAVAWLLPLLRVETWKLNGKFIIILCLFFDPVFHIFNIFIDYRYLIHKNMVEKYREAWINRLITFNIPSVSAFYDTIGKIYIYQLENNGRHKFSKDIFLIQMISWFHDFLASVFPYYFPIFFAWLGFCFTNWQTEPNKYNKRKLSNKIIGRQWTRFRKK